MVKVIYKGIDQLDFTINGLLRVGVIDALQKAKEQAISQDYDAPFEFGKLKGLVQPTGGKGGWTYILNTETETYTIKDSQWGVRVSVRSLLLSNAGYRGSLHEVLERVDAIIARKDLRVGRIDIAVDMQVPHWHIDPDLFVMSGQLAMAIDAKIDCTDEELDELKKKQKSMMRIYKKKNVETVTVGKKNNFQLQVYNKTRQVAQTPKAEYWRNIWALNPEYDENETIWRFETRFGRDYFKRRKINDFQCFDAQIGDIVRKVTQQVYIVKEMKSNVARDCEMCDVWSVMRGAMSEYADTMVSGVERMIPLSEQLQAIKERRLSRAKQQMISLSTSVMAMRGEKNLDSEILEFEILKFMGHITSDNDLWEKMLDDFSKKIQEYEYLEYGVID